MNIKVDSNTKELMEDLENSVAQYKKELKLQVFRALSVLETEIKQNIRKNAGLHVRTGALLNSVSSTKKVIDDGKTISGEIGTEGVPYAAIHEFGGTIVPTNKQWLTIPSEDNRRPDGLPKMSTKDLMATGKSFIAKNTIFLKEGSGIKAMFFLKKSVTIPKRPYISTALAAKQEQIMKDFGLFLSMSFGTKE